MSFVSISDPITIPPNFFTSDTESQKLVSQKVIIWTIKFVPALYKYLFQVFIQFPTICSS